MKRNPRILSLKNTPRELDWELILTSQAVSEENSKFIIQLFLRMFKSTSSSPRLKRYVENPRVGAIKNIFSWICIRSIKYDLILIWKKKNYVNFVTARCNEYWYFFVMLFVFMKCNLIYLLKEVIFKVEMFQYACIYI